jgi:PAS domain S-box-containing protein
MSSSSRTLCLRSRRLSPRRFTVGQEASRRAVRTNRPAGTAGSPRVSPAAVTPAVVRALIDALHDGVALADADGTIALANRRMEEMFGYAPGELLGQPVESLIPAELRAVHRRHRAGYAQAPRIRPMGAGARLVGLRKDGTTFLAEISLSPLRIATSHLALTVTRDVTKARRLEDLAGLARAAIAAEQAHRGQELLDRLSGSLFQVGLSLQAASGQPHGVASIRIAEALQHLDDAIRDIRRTAFASHS